MCPYLLWSRRGASIVAFPFQTRFAANGEETEAKRARSCGGGGPVAEMHVIGEGRGARAPGSVLKDREQRSDSGDVAKSAGLMERPTFGNASAFTDAPTGGPSGRLFCLLCETKRVKVITSAPLFGFAQKLFVCSGVQHRKTASAEGTG